MKQKPDLSFWKLWNLSFGFFGVQIAYALQSANISMSKPKIITMEMLRPSEPAFGKRHITATAVKAPINR